MRISWVLPHTASRRPLAGDSAGERGSIPVGVGTPEHIFSQSVLYSLALGRAPSVQVTTTRSLHPQGRAQTGPATPCGDRPAAGPAGPRSGPARTGLPTHERKKIIGEYRRRDRWLPTEGGQGCPGVAGAGLKIGGANNCSRKLSGMSMDQTGIG